MDTHFLHASRSSRPRSRGPVSILLALLLATQIVAPALPLGHVRTASANSAWGTLLVRGSDWGGVDVYSNGNDYLSPDGSYGEFGWKFQCVELVQRFYYQMGWSATKVWGGDAWKMYDTAPADIQRKANDGGYRPVWGDVIVFATSSKWESGHVAIVTGYANGRIQFVEQNVGSQSNLNATGRGSLAMNGNVIEVGGSGRPGIRGVLHSPKNGSGGVEPPPSQPGDGLAVYAGQNMTGDSVLLTYSGNDTCLSLGNVSKRASSLAFRGSYRGGYDAILYSDGSCGSYIARYGDDQASFGMLNGVPGSVRLERHGAPPAANCDPGPDVVVFYLDDDYHGQCHAAGIGDYPNPGAIGLPNDQITAVRVGANVRVQVCRDDNYGGACDWLDGNDSNLSDNAVGNDQVSSARVQTKPQPTPAPVCEPHLVVTRSLSLDPTVPVFGAPVTSVFTITNDGCAATILDYVGVAVRGPAGEQLDFPMSQNIPLPPGASYAYTGARGDFNANGTYHLWVVALTDQGWVDVPSAGGQAVELTTNWPCVQKPLLIGGVTFDQEPTFGAVVTTTITVENPTSCDFAPALIGLGGRGPKGDQDWADFPLQSGVVVPAGKRWTYTATRTFENGDGAYRFFPVYYDGEYWYQFGPTAGQSTEVNPVWTCTAKPTVSGLAVEPSGDFGRLSTATVTITNACPSKTYRPVRIGIAGRDANGANVDFPLAEGVVVGPNSSYVYRARRTFDAAPGTFTFWPVAFDGTYWFELFDASGGSTKITPTWPCLAPPAASVPVLDPERPVAGQEVTVRVTYTNRCAAMAMAVAKIGVAVRQGETQLDFPMADSVTIPAGGVYQYVAKRTFPSAGKLHLWAVVSFDGQYWPAAPTEAGPTAALDAIVGNAGGTSTPVATVTPDPGDDETPDPSSDDAVVAVEPAKGGYGAAITTTIENFTPGDEVEFCLVIGTRCTTIATVDADEAGAAEVTWTAPAADYGAHILRATDDDGVTAETTFSVTAHLRRSASSGVPGSSLALTADGMTAGSQVKFTLCTKTTCVALKRGVTANSKGRARATVKIPADLGPGKVTLRATDAQGHKASASFRITGVSAASVHSKPAAKTTKTATAEPAASVTATATATPVTVTPEPTVSPSPAATATVVVATPEPSPSPTPGPSEPDPGATATATATVAPATETPIPPEPTPAEQTTAEPVDA